MISKIIVVKQKQHMYERILYSFDDVIHWHDYALMIMKNERIIVNQFFGRISYQLRDENSIQ